MTKKLFMAMAMLALSGCSGLASWLDASPLQLVVNIEAANNINPNINGLASPLEVRIYQLQDSEAFSQASFIDLYSDDQGVLKADLLSKRNLDSVLPNEKREVELPLSAETAYVGVVAAFADYREAKNKAIVQILTGLPAVIDVKVDGINVSISDQED